MKWSLSIFLILFFIKANSQIAERQLISSGGQTSSVGNLSFDWSIGEVIIDQSNPYFLQGFHQSNQEIEIIIKKQDLPKDYNTIITPGDGSNNDFFYIDNLPDQSELFVFDKWGNKLYNKSNYQGEWDGHTNSGNEIQDGVYVFFIKDAKGDIIYKGTITVRRRQ